jgi:ankyrin repeat protein
MAHRALVLEAFDMDLHELLDWSYGPYGDDRLTRALAGGADPNDHRGPGAETPLHVAARRRRRRAAEILLAHGADIEARTAGGKTAYAHAVRRGFDDVVEALLAHGARTDLSDADRLAVAMVEGRLDEARAILAASPGAARTANPEEDRLLADVAGRPGTERVALLIGAGADLTARAMDSGTALHQAAWFGQPDNARLLIDAGAPLDDFDATHHSSPLGWAVHGSRYSGGAEEHQDAYVALARMLLEAGSSLRYPGEADGDGGDSYFQRLVKDATPRVAELLRAARR